MSGSLFSMTESLKRLMDYAGSDDPDEQRAFHDTLEAVKGEIGIKCDSYVYVLKMLEGNREKCEKGADFLTDKAKRIDRNIKDMKKAILDAVEAAPPDAEGKHRIQGDDFEFVSQRNGGNPQIIFDGDVPAEYMKMQPVTYVKDTDKILKALSEGKELPFAHLGKRGTHLVIK